MSGVEETVRSHIETLIALGKTREEIPGLTGEQIAPALFCERGYIERIAEIELESMHVPHLRLVTK